MPENPIIKHALSLIENDDPKVLGLTFGAAKVKPGVKIPKGEAQGLPKLAFPALSGDYLVVSVDLDAPFPSFAPLSPALHWIQSSLKADPTTDELTSSEAPIASWVGPGPPPISSPHRYVFFLYKQPTDFDVGKFTKEGGRGFGIRDRIRFDLPKFEKEAKLGPAIAASYFWSN